MTKITLKKVTPSTKVSVFTGHYRIADKCVSANSAGSREDAVISGVFPHKFILLLACPRIVWPKFITVF